LPIFDTLISVYKEQDILPWHGCFELCVDEKDFNRIPTFKNELIKFGLNIFTTKSDIKIFSCNIRNIKNWSWPYISIIKFKIDGDSIHLKNTIDNKNYILNRDSVYPFNKCSFKNLSVDMPNKVENILDILYTNSWRTSCISSKYDYKNNKMYYKTFNIKWYELNFHKEDISFENTWVINLERCTTRWKKTKKRLQKIGINPNRWNATDKNTEFIKEEYKKLKGVIIGISIGVFSCYISHKKLWEHLYKIEVPYAIIFEDDIIINDSIKLKDISNIIKKCIGFNIIFLGYTSPNRPLFSEQYITEGGGTCLHAYVISRKGLGNLLKLKHDFSQPVDKVVKDFSENNLCYISKNIKSKHYGYGIIYQDMNIESDLRFRFNIFGINISL